jgi:hypothetical protein
MRPSQVLAIAFSLMFSKAVSSSGECSDGDGVLCWPKCCREKEIYSVEKRTCDQSSVYHPRLVFAIFKKYHLPDTAQKSIFKKGV